MTERRVVLGVALLAVLARFPGLMWPLRPDEAGFLLVARAWDPQPDSPYGPHFVDRPPLLLWVIRTVDSLAGPYALRVVGALACGAAVLLVAAVVAELARHPPRPAPERALRLVTAGSAILTAAFLATPQIDAVATKSELLGVPILFASALLALRAVRLGAAPSAAGAGLLALLAVGLKQSLVGGVVFAGVLWAVSWATGRIQVGTFVRLTAAALVGAAVPVLATVVWARWAGVELSALWYVVVSFRGDASAVLAAEPNRASDTRTLVVGLIFVATGMALVVVWCLARAVRTVKAMPAAALAALTMLVVDLLVVVMSGSFWTPYLFTPIVSLMLLWVCVRVSDLPDLGPQQTMLFAGPPTDSRWRRPRWEVLLVAACALSTVVSLSGWVVKWGIGPPPREHLVGEAVGEAAVAGDDLVVYGGRADIQYASGLPSPYAHLWSLPMRTLDPELSELEALLRDAEQAPSWFVTAVRLDAWRGQGQVLEDTLAEHYRSVTVLCDDFEVYRHADAPPAGVPQVDCDTPYGRR